MNQINLRQDLQTREGNEKPLFLYSNKVCLFGMNLYQTFSLPLRMGTK